MPTAAQGTAQSIPNLTSDSSINSSPTVKYRTPSGRVDVSPSLELPSPVGTATTSTSGVDISSTAESRSPSSGTDFLPLTKQPPRQEDMLCIVPLILADSLSPPQVLCLPPSVFVSHSLPQSALHLFSQVFVSNPLLRQAMYHLYGLSRVCSFCNRRQIRLTKGGGRDLLPSPTRQHARSR